MSAQINGAAAKHLEDGAIQIGELAAEMGINPKTIRYYEEIGLLPEPRRTDSGYRLYGAGDRDRLAFIAKAKAVGLTLGQIGEIIARRDSGESPCDHVVNLLDQRLAAIDEQLRVLADLREELAGIKDASAGRQGEDAAICGIIERHQPHRRTSSASMIGSPTDRPVSNH
jgi:MerR family Zn(II)-responsive transcriptional regulator of zntA